MSQTEIIWIVVTLTFSSTVGVYAAIRYIKLHTRHPVNTLVRSGDIELADYIEPVRPINTYYPNQFDLVNNQFSVLERVSYAPTYYTGPNPPSFQSAILPRYQSVDGIDFFVNSSLENTINLDYILWLILFFIIMIISWKSLYAMAMLIPFSLFDIDFRDSFEWKLDSGWVKHKISYLKIQRLTEDLVKLLDSLTEYENYSLSLSFISSYNEWQDDKEKINPIWIADAIIINRESDPVLITQFIMNGINNQRLLKSDWWDSSLSDPVILIVTIRIKVKL